MLSRVTLAGSERSHPSDSVDLGSVGPAKNIQITLLLRRQPQPHAQGTGRVSRAAFARSHGADPLDVEAVRSFASAHALSVERVSLAARTVDIRGPVGTLSKLFGADIRLSQVGRRIYRTRQGSLHLPAALVDRVVAVLGFDQRPAAGTNFRKEEKVLASVAYTPCEISSIYNFPPNTGKGQTIALIELGGGYVEQDLTSYWQSLGLPKVAVKTVNVDGAANQPIGDSNSADSEVALDIEVAGAAAPGANIVVYFAPNTDAGFLNAINAAIHDEVNRPSVISISWGAAELSWTAQSKNAFNAAFEDAAMLGISVCVAAGDAGSSDGEKDKRKHVDFPASSPWVLACGGTRLLAGNGQIFSETVWNDTRTGGSTGGGVSAYFSKPGYQDQIKVPKPSDTRNATGRGLPDVAAVADPQTGYRVLIDGQELVLGGTSAVAPLWAALIALCNEQLGRNAGWLNPTLYGTLGQHRVTHDITSGTNGAYRAGNGWDCCTGLGTPDGLAILRLLQQAKA